MNNLENFKHDPDRSVFEHHFGSGGWFGAIILRLYRQGKINLEEIKDSDESKLRFVSGLIGENEANKLSPKERDVFRIEAERIILKHKEMIADSERLQMNEAERLGIVDKFSRDAKGDIAPHGNPEAYERHIND